MAKSVRLSSRKKATVIALSVMGVLCLIVAVAGTGYWLLGRSVDAYFYAPNYDEAQVNGIVEYGWPKIVPTSVTDIYRYTPKDDVCIWMRFRITQSDEAKMTNQLEKLSEVETVNLNKDPRRSSIWQNIVQNQPNNLDDVNLDYYIGKNLCDTCYPNRNAYVAVDMNSDLAYYWCE
ncbi:MAG: hypothetical protein ACYC5F_05290 [Thermoleophilia bacterium]